MPKKFAAIAQGVIEQDVQDAAGVLLGSDGKNSLDDVPLKKERMTQLVPDSFRLMVPEGWCVLMMGTTGELLADISMMQFDGTRQYVLRDEHGELCFAAARFKTGVTVIAIEDIRDPKKRDSLVLGDGWTAKPVEPTDNGVWMTLAEVANYIKWAATLPPQ